MDNLRGVEVACCYDLVRRGQFISIKNDTQCGVVFETHEGPVVVVGSGETFTLRRLREIARGGCILAIVSEDSSVVYYGLSPVSVDMASARAVQSRDI